MWARAGPVIVDKEIRLNASPSGRTLLIIAVATITLSVPLLAQDLTELVPMRDGVRLSTDVYAPDEPSPWPAILLRTPYDKATDFASPGWINEVNDAGYAYVIQDMRGRYASEGTDSTFWTDGWGYNQDGYETVEWLAAQSWCDGNVGMFGESARGIIQYLAAGAAPPHLKACVSMIACEDFYHKAFFQGGEFRKELVEIWFQSQGSEYMLPFFLSHPTRDAFWDSLDLATRAPEVTVPILHVGGHYDTFGESAIDAYNLLQFGGGLGALDNQRLVLGPWTHWGIDSLSQGELTYPENASYDLRTLRWRWFDHWLKGEQNGVDTEPPVAYYLMGDVDDPYSPGNEWIEADVFPPEVTPTPLYLHAERSPTPYSLQSVPPPHFADGYEFSSDPAFPVPTLGGRNLNIIAGTFDQRPVHDGRYDVIRLSTDELVEPIAVAGKVTFIFWANVSTPDVNWTAKLIDVYPDGREMLVTDGILRARFRNGFETEEFMEPSGWYRFEIDLWSTAIVFNVGHRIMLAIANSNYPRFEINPNTDDPFGQGGDPLPADIILLAESDHPSRLMLPILWGTVTSAPALVLDMDDARLRVLPSRNPAPRFTLEILGAADGPIRGAIHTPDGRRVWSVGIESTAGGLNHLTWDGRDLTGRRVASGVYFLRLVDETGRHGSARLVLVR